MHRAPVRTWYTPSATTVLVLIDTDLNKPKQFRSKWHYSFCSVGPRWNSMSMSMSMSLCASRNDSREWHIYTHGRYQHFRNTAHKSHRVPALYATDMPHAPPPPLSPVTLHLPAHRQTQGRGCQARLCCDGGEFAERVLVGRQWCRPEFPIRSQPVLLREAHPRVGVGRQEPHLHIGVGALQPCSRFLDAHGRDFDGALVDIELVLGVGVWRVPPVHLAEKQTSLRPPVYRDAVAPSLSSPPPLFPTGLGGRWGMSTPAVLPPTLQGSQGPRPAGSLHVRLT